MEIFIYILQVLGICFGIFRAIGIASNKDPFNTSDSLVNRILMTIIFLMVTLDILLDLLQKVI